MEIHEKPQFIPAQFQVAEQLGSMYWPQLFDSLQLHHHLFFDQKIHSVAGIDTDALKINRRIHLATHIQASLFQYMQQADFVCTFKQSGAKCFVHPDRRINQRFTNLVFGHFALLASWRFSPDY